MSNYTPGPWVIGERVKTARLDNALMIRPLDSHNSEYGATAIIATSDANASLIVAAPENYESNKELAKIVRELCAAYNHPLPDAALSRSDKAIAKAEGEV
jgi:hypothetical protein